MASHSVSISTISDFEQGFSITFSPATSSGSRDDFGPNDTVTFTYVSALFGSPTVTLSGFSSAYWTNTSSVTLSLGQSVTKTLKSTFGNGSVDVLRSGYTGDTHYFTVANDITPDPFVFADVTAAEISTYYYSNIVTISGLGATATASASGGHVSVNGGGWASSASISNGQTLRVRRLTGSSYFTNYSTTVTVGTVSDVWTIKTKINQVPALVVDFNRTSLPVSLSQVKSFFGGNGNLSSYLKGGALVPDIAKNNAIQSSLPINLSNFIGSGNALFWTNTPRGKESNVNTWTGVRQAILEWILGIDYSFGYGDIATGLEYKFTLVENTGAGLTTGIDVVVNVPNAFSSTNNRYTLKKTFPQYSPEKTYTGTVTFQARHALDTSKVITESFSYQISSYNDF